MTDYTAFVLIPLNLFSNNQHTFQPMNEPPKSIETPPRKRNNTVLVLGVCLVVAVVAAVFFATRTSTLQKQLDRLPVAVTYRKAMMGAGYVLQIRNSSGKSLPLKITLTNPTFNKTKTFDVVADASPKPFEIGHLEGWTLTSGDVIQVSSEGFEPMQGKVP